MSPHQSELIIEKRSVPRRTFLIILVLWLLTTTALAVVAWNAYFGEKDKVLTLSEQIDAACRQGEPGRLADGISPELEKQLCENAAEVLEENDSELQDREIQEREEQEPEIQERENQERETQEKERQEAEIQNPENQDDESQEDELQDGEIDDPDPDDPENQDPEIDDPDPASPYDFSFIFTIPGDGLMVPDRTYTVFCNSGTGQCTVEES